MPIYLKLGKIDGGVTESDHVDWIDIASMQFGSGRAVTTPTGTATNRSATAPSISEITLSKTFDKSSNNLFNEAVVGKGQDAKIHFMRSQADGMEMFLEYTLTEAMVSSYSMSSGGDVPSETISLNFTKVEMRYLPTKTDGGLGSALTAGYDLKTGKKM